MIVNIFLVWMAGVSVVGAFSLGKCFGHAVMILHCDFHSSTRNNPFPDTNHSLKSIESTKSLTSQQQQQLQQTKE